MPLFWSLELRRRWFLWESFLLCCVLLWMAPCVSFQSILKGYYVIMSLFHFPEMRENVDLSIYWRKVSVIISVLTFNIYLIFFWQNQKNEVNLSLGFTILLNNAQEIKLARKSFCLLSGNVTITRGISSWSPEPSAPHHEKVLVTGPDCRW